MAQTAGVKMQYRNDAGTKWTKSFDNLAFSRMSNADAAKSFAEVYKAIVDGDLYAVKHVVTTDVVLDADG